MPPLLCSVERACRRAGFDVADDGRGRFRATREGLLACVEWLRNGSSDRAVCLRARRLSDRDDAASDYAAGAFCDSIRGAIRMAEKMDAWAREGAGPAALPAARGESFVGRGDAGGDRER